MRREHGRRCAEGSRTPHCRKPAEPDLVEQEGHIGPRAAAAGRDAIAMMAPAPAPRDAFDGGDDRLRAAASTLDQIAGHASKRSDPLVSILTSGP